MAFCVHGKVQTTCEKCRPQATLPVPDREAVIDRLSPDWDWTWYEYRRECHDRIRRLLLAAHGAPWGEDLYYSIYDKSPGTPPMAEHPSTFPAAFRRAFVKMNDLTIDGRRVQGYNAAGDWDQVMALTDPIGKAGFPDAVRDKRILIHGGNGSWSHQQRPAWEGSRKQKAEWGGPHQAMHEVIDAFCFGRDDRTPADLSDGEMERRIDASMRLAEERAFGLTVSLCSKLALIFDPARWPVTNLRTGPDVARKLGIDLSTPRNGSDYLEYAKLLRQYAAEEALPDMERLDILFSRQYSELHDRDGPL